jgi:hypothetical protein
MNVRDIPNTLPRRKRSFTPSIFSTPKKLHCMPFIHFLTNILGENIGIINIGFYKIQFLQFHLPHSLGQSDIWFQHAGFIAFFFDATDIYIETFSCSYTVTPLVLLELLLSCLSN